MEISTTADFDSPAQSVWSLMEDFAAIARWWPRDGAIRIERVEVEGNGIGMIRHIFNIGMDKPVSERLDLVDAQNRILILSIVGERAGGITAYVAIARLEALSGDSCRLHYHAYVTAQAGKEERVKKNILFTWERMFGGLREAARETSLPQCDAGK